MPYTIIKLNPKTYQVQDKKTGKMSHLINKKRKDCFTVINTETGKIHAKCTSLQNAKAQIRLLYGLESGDWKPTGKRDGGQVVVYEGDNDDNSYDDEDEMDAGVGLYIDPEVPMMRGKKGKGQEEMVEQKETQTPPPVKETWKTFFSKHAKGKKFASQEDSHEFMRKIGALWRAHKDNKKMVKEMESKAKKAMKKKMMKAQKGKMT